MKNKEWFKDKHISFHDAVIESISILREGRAVLITEELEKGSR